MRSAKKVLTLPASLSIKVLEEKWFREYQIWIALKFISNGSLLIDGVAKNKLNKMLGISDRTIDRAVSQLRSRNWLGYNKNTNIIYVRSIDTVRSIEGIDNRTAYYFNIKWINLIRPYCIGVGISELIRQQKRRLYEERRQRLGKKWQRIKLPRSYYPVSLESLHQIYGLSLSNAGLLRRKAAGLFIQLKPNFTPFLVNRGKISYMDFKAMKNHVREQDRNRVFNHKGIAHIQQPSLVKSLLTKKKRRKLD